MKRTWIAIYLLLVTSTFGQIIYVDVNVSGGSNNGTNWANAYTSLQSALTNAVSGNQIWVANGTYIPSSPYSLTLDGDRDFHFEMKEGVAIYGGFAGGESQITSRVNFGAGEANETILSGDIGNVGVNTDNCFHVIFNPSGLTNAAVLDGFTIKGGYANLAGADITHASGGGVYINASSPLIRNCTFTNNYAYYGAGIINLGGSGKLNNCTFTNNAVLYSGAGLFNYGESSLAVSDCTFDNNSASDTGGGIAVWSNSNSTITGCIFKKNSADNGGGAWIYQSPIDITNCLFSGNTADYGGGIEINDCSAVIFNCTLGGNSASSSGGGMYNSSASPVVTNSIFWGNYLTGDLSVSEIGYGTESNFTYCCIRGGSGTYTGTGNIFIDPAFVDADGTDNIFGTSDDDFSLRNSSPCIGAGTNTGAPSTDILGTTRGNPPDMGPYENSLNSPTTNIIYVNANVSGGSNNGTSWANAYTSLQSALSEALIYDQIWVANGTYKPTFGADRGIYFEMKNDIEIYGGFAGNESAISGRTNYGIGEANETILSGDIGTIGTLTDNSYHVIKNPSGIDNTAVLDGFTITGGYSTGSDTDTNGGGMYNYGASPTIRNCCFAYNYGGDDGGGMSNTESSSPKISDCKFIGNSILNLTEEYEGGGGGIYNYNSSPVITDCIFLNNSAKDAGEIDASGGAICIQTGSAPTITNSIFNGNTADQGGAIFDESSKTSVITNCVFSGNTTTYSGGAILVSYYGWGADTTPIITNCTFANNTAGYNGGGILLTNDTNAKIKNSIFWDNSHSGQSNLSEIEYGYYAKYEISYCCIQEGSAFFEGSGNTFGNPAFVDADGADNTIGTSDDNLSLKSESSCIDMGTTTGSPVKDILGITRDSNPDKGAYEYQSTSSRYFVDASKADDSQDGTSWATAKKTLQAALDIATRKSEIWVKAGTYYPTTETGGTGDRYKTFQMENGIEIYGGFAGSESTVSERTDYGAGGSHETILSGDVGISGNNSDNCYHVFYHPEISSLNQTAVIDGFTITNGNADGTEFVNKHGGGMYNYYSSPSILNCTFINNTAYYYGGGISNYYRSSPVITNSVFNNNTATGAGVDSKGGAIDNREYSSPGITSCIFTNNTAAYGGGIENWISSSPTITNCAFVSNVGSHCGGAINNSSAPEIINCSFTNNSSGNGGAIYNDAGITPTIFNSIFWGDFKLIHLTVDEIDNGNFANITYCCIQNGSGTFTGTGNIFNDPLFTDADGADNIYGTSDDDLSLFHDSPCIGAGTATGSPSNDIVNVLRGTPPDLGAYENSLNSPLPVELISFNASISNESVVLNWTTATEVNNYGFNVERTSTALGTEWETVGFVKGSGNSNSPKEYSYTDIPTGGTKFSYRLKQIDIDGAYEYSDVVEVTLAVPTNFAVEQNFPNPFNPTTTIKYQVPSVSNVSLKVFDILGREAATLVNEQKAPGKYEVKFDGSKLSSGIYFYKLQAGDFVQTKKLILMK